ncbi:MAG: hypothetical protein J4428_00605 [Candidatus Aenigmarchaeota archaeon]|nr:hypothetical protein [Candidatus Aenigmarchaeota archaeon]
MKVNDTEILLDALYEHLRLINDASETLTTLKSRGLETHKYFYSIGNMIREVEIFLLDIAQRSPYIRNESGDYIPEFETLQRQSWILAQTSKITNPRLADPNYISRKISELKRDVSVLRSKISETKKHHSKRSKLEPLALTTLGIIAISGVGLSSLLLSSTQTTARLIEPSSLTYPFGLAFLAILTVSLIGLGHKKN